MFGQHTGNVILALAALTFLALTNSVHAQSAGLNTSTWEKTDEFRMSCSRTVVFASTRLPIDGIGLRALSKVPSGFIRGNFVADFRGADRLIQVAGNSVELKRSDPSYYMLPLIPWARNFSWFCKTSHKYNKWDQHRAKCHRTSRWLILRRSGRTLKISCFR